MQNSDQPIRQTDKNKGDQSAVEQQQKEQTGKKPSPENMSGSQNAQQDNEADQQVRGKSQHITNNDGAPVNASRDTEEPQNMWGPGKEGQQGQGQGKQDMGKTGSSQQKDQWSQKDKNQEQDQQNKGGKGSGQGQNKNPGK
ncbi:hypothetical protein Q4E93_01915 [Flavitalea sp. BT771]|uniref:hypothetical protein n=1 Tax=Flavitalea sp. BT771 TaxID=3063329 RepID=UPI0026E2D6BF|nr:hypothetical protein [Flavitalea sp. BT771]MDO6429325.1 hypothetical protein [Flavitalea sp. BT771]MDV6218547.1 hypothetical protein [Flavitalea sp. BT771]